MFSLDCQVENKITFSKYLILRFAGSREMRKEKKPVQSLYTGNNVFYMLISTVSFYSSFRNYRSLFYRNRFLKKPVCYYHPSLFDCYLGGFLSYFIAFNAHFDFISRFCINDFVNQTAIFCIILFC